jgi:hypothetical protein
VANKASSLQRLKDLDEKMEVENAADPDREEARTDELTYPRSHLSRTEASHFRGLRFLFLCGKVHPMPPMVAVEVMTCIGIE